MEEQTLSDLLATIIPSAVTCLIGDPASSLSAGRDVVGTAIEWFFGEDCREWLGGKELDPREVGIGVAEIAGRNGLDEETAAVLTGGLMALSESVAGAVTGPAWQSGEPSEDETESLLRAGIRALVGAAFYAVTGSLAAKDEAEQRCVGFELDSWALIAAVGEPAPP